MMHKQSEQFILGYVFHSIKNNIPNSANSYNRRYSIDVPKIWFGLACSTDNEVDLSDSQKRYLKSCLTNLLYDCGKHKIVIEIYPANQYIRFSYKFPAIRKMTFSEIEKALGYKIELISE